MAWNTPPFVSGSTTPQQAWFDAVNDCLEEIDPHTRNALPRSTPMGANGAYKLRPFDIQDALERNTTQFLNFACIGGRAGKLQGGDYVHNEQLGKGFTLHREIGTDCPGDDRGAGRWMLRARDADANIGVLGPWFDLTYDAYMYGDISLTTEATTNFLFGLMDWDSGFPTDRFHFNGPEHGIFFAFDGANTLLTVGKKDGTIGHLRNTQYENSANTLFRFGIAWDSSAAAWSFYIGDELIWTASGTGTPVAGDILRPAIGMMLISNPIQAPITFNIYGDVFAWQEG